MSIARYQSVLIESIVVESQVRVENSGAEDEEGLVATIKQHGVVQPVTIYPEGGKLVLLLGHRRLVGARKAGLTHIEARVVAPPRDKLERTIRQLLENLQKVDLSPFEKAVNFAAVLKGGMKAVELTATLGISKATVSKHVALLRLPPELLAHVRSGRLGLADGYELSCEQDPAKQAALAGRKLGGGTEGEAAKGKPSRRASKPRKRSRAASSVGNNKETGAGGALRTVHRALEDLAAKVRRAAASKGDNSSAATLGGDVTLDSMLRTLESWLERLRNPPIARE